MRLAFRMVWIIGLLLATIATGRADIVTTFTFGSGQPGGEPSQLPQFDPSLGTLLFAMIYYEQSWTITLKTGDGGYGPNEPTTGGGGDFSVAGVVYSNTYVSELPIVTGPEYYAPDSTYTVGASAGDFDGFQGGSEIADAMTGTGTVSWASNVGLVWSWNCDCPGSSSFVSATEGFVTVDYAYIPEPGTYALTLLGVEALALGVRRMRLK